MSLLNRCAKTIRTLPIPFRTRRRQRVGDGLCGPLPVQGRKLVLRCFSFGDVGQRADETRAEAVGDAHQQRILAAAIQEFAGKGYNAASINVIARNAGIEGIGFAIPVDLVRGVVDAIVRDGRVVRGWIGIRPQSLKPEECRQFGFPAGSVIVTAVYRGGPAVTEGVRPGDVVIKVNGQAISGAEDLLARIAALAPGESVGLEIRRGPPFEGPPREHSVRIKVIERPAQAAATS